MSTDHTPDTPTHSLASRQFDLKMIKKQNEMTQSQRNEPRLLCSFLLRNCTSSRRPSRRSSIQFHPRRPTTLRCGRPLRPRTAMSARGCCGVSPGRECAAQSVALNVTRSARTSSMQTVYKVRSGNWEIERKSLS